MAKYSHEPDNATKSCKARGSNLRVHFKVLNCPYILYSLFTGNSRMHCLLVAYRILGKQPKQ